MNKPESPTDAEVRAAIDTVIAHLGHYWGFCSDEHYTLGCASCEASRLRASLLSVANFLEDEE